MGSVAPWQQSSPIRFEGVDAVGQSCHQCADAIASGDMIYGKLPSRVTGNGRDHTCDD
jgi:hypothetical protein